jgi:hypothetical protein
MRAPRSALGLLALALALPAQTLELDDITEECGLAGQAGNRVAFGDYDADGDPDLLAQAKRLYRNDSRRGQIRFTDVTDAAGLDGLGGGGACWLDFDRDGHLDIVTNSLQVWLGDGAGRFRNIRDRLGVETLPRNHGSAIGAGDLDGDGWLDILVGGGEVPNSFQLVPQTLWRNLEGRRLEDVTAVAGGLPAQYGRAIVWCDYDRDGDADVYSGNYRLRPNALLRNDHGTLEDVAAAAGVTGRNDQTMFTDPRTGARRGYRYGHTIAAAWADLNGDGLFDLWVSNLAHKAIGKVDPEFAKLIGSDFDDRGYDCDDSNLFINLGPPTWTFEDRRVAMGIPIIEVQDYATWPGDELWSNAACADVDGNGWIDVYVNQVYVQQPNSFAHLYLNDQGRFTEAHDQLPCSLWGGYGAAWADLDSDGRMDLVAGGAPRCNGKQSIHVFHNRTRTGPWIGFVLRGGDERVQTVGTTVLLVQEHGVQVRQAETTMGSHTQQNDSRLHFGLGKRGRILDVVVTWSDGRRQSLGKPRPGSYHAVEPPSGNPIRITKVMPATATVGAEVTLRARGLSGRATCYWSFTPTCLVDEITRKPTVTHTFAAPGTYPCLVRAVASRGRCAELPFTVEVTDR